MLYFSLQNVTLTLDQLSARDPRGYFLQDLWSGTQFGLFAPSTPYSVVVSATGVHLFKATLAL